MEAQELWLHRKLLKASCTGHATSEQVLKKADYKKKIIPIIKYESFTWGMCYIVKKWTFTCGFERKNKMTLTWWVGRQLYCAAEDA